MNCPNCHKKVKDGASICPFCDAILDESILGAMPGDGDGAEDTPPPAPPPKKPAARPAAAKPAARPGASTPAARPASAPRKPAAARPAPVKARAPIDEPEPEAEPAPEPEPQPSADGKYQSKWSQYWTEDEPAPKAMVDPNAHAEAMRAELVAKVKAETSGDVSDPFAELTNLGALFKKLHFEDKLTVSSAIGLFLMSLMSWRSYHEDAQGDDFGFMTWGFLTLLLAVATLLAVWARHNGKLDKVVPRFRLPHLCGAAGALAAVIAFLFVITNFDTDKKGNPKSQPAFGAYFSAVFGAGVLVGGLLTSRREKS